MSNQFTEFSYRDHDSGLIEVITGPMFSGKTEELIKRLTRHQLNGKKVVCIKPTIDDRYHQTKIVSHDNNVFEALAIDTLEEMLELSHSSDVIGIDEAQFFHESITDMVSSIANRGKRVIISGLNLDYKGSPFTTLANLMAIAENIVVKQGTCSKCGDLSTHTTRKASLSADRIVIGGSELYMPTCRKCFSLVQ